MQTLLNVAEIQKKALIAYADEMDARNKQLPCFTCQHCRPYFGALMCVESSVNPLVFHGNCPCDGKRHKAAPLSEVVRRGLCMSDIHTFVFKSSDEASMFEKALKLESELMFELFGLSLFGRDDLSTAVRKIAVEERLNEVRQMRKEQ